MSKLDASLKGKFNFLSKIIPGPINRYMLKETKRLEGLGYDVNALDCGDDFPNEMMLDHMGKAVDLHDLIEGKTIINFYRGSWCPYCNLELAFYDELLKEPENNHIKMIAISPERPEVSAKKKDVDNLSFSVLSDLDNKLAKKTKLLYILPRKLVIYYKLMGASLKKSQGNDTGALPVPATYIIDETMKITHRWLDTDYTKRADPEEVIAAYKAI